MSTCIFFGNRTATSDLSEKIISKIKYLINEKGVNLFYVGNHGNFDKIVMQCLIEVKKQYENIDYAIVLAYMPKKELDYTDKTIFPEGQESALPKYAINKRNKWMLKNADYLITYVSHPGNSALLREEALKKGICVIDILDSD